LWRNSRGSSWLRRDRGRRSWSGSGSRRLRLWRGLRGLSGGFLIGELLEMFPHQYGVLDIDRAGMRLLLRDADFRQVIDQDLRLDLEFPRQFVNADLIRI
jgi:hypothetical protein